MKLAKEQKSRKGKLIKLSSDFLVEAQSKNPYYRKDPEEFKKLTSFIASTPIPSISILLKFQHCELLKWIESMLIGTLLAKVAKSKKITIATKVYWILHGLVDFPRCKECGRSFEEIGRVNVVSLSAGYERMFCSNSCATKNKDTIAKHEQTNITRHGTRVWTNREKAEKTTLDHLGVKCALSDPNVRAKGQETMLRDYGAKYFPQTARYKELSEKSCLEAYGETCYMKTKQFREQSKKTKLEKYGDENWNNHEKGEQTCLDRYGVRSNFQTEEHKALLRSNHEEISRKRRATFRKNYGQDLPPTSKYEYGGVRFDSMPEIALYIWLKDHDIQFEYHPDITFEYEYTDISGKTRKTLYHPDFKIGETIYELKGDHFFKEDGTMWDPYRSQHKDEEYWLLSCRRMEAKHQCMLANNVVILREAEYHKYLEYVWKKYGKQYLQQFRKKIRRELERGLDQH